MKNTFVALTITLGIFLFTSTPSHAEWYGGVQLGFVLPDDLKKVKGVGNAKGISLSNLDVKNSFIYGAKAGYFFPGMMDFLGVELEVFTANPHIKQQSTTAKLGSSSTKLDGLSGNHLRVITTALNLMVRYPGYMIEPYAGAGIGAFWAKLSDSAGSDTDVAPGLNVLGGFRFYLNQQVALFTEGKFNYTRWKFNDSSLKFAYKSYGASAGVTIHF